MFKVKKQGVLTSVQDVRGRQGCQYLGFPPSGAMDQLALTIGNVLVGNDPDEAGLEYTFSGPELFFMDDALVAVTGAAMKVMIDGEEKPMYQALLVRAGQTLAVMPAAQIGQWGYIAVSGGIDVPEYLGSKATFTFCSIGGFKGRNLLPGDEIPTGAAKDFSLEGKRLKGRYIPIITQPMVVELMPGYYYDYLTPDDIENVFSTPWKVQMDSNRSGYRIKGPHIEFSDKARNKSADAGSDPSNIFDTGYPVYAINMTGDTSIILTNETVTAGGYMCPFCIPKGSQWKIGQVRIGTEMRFTMVDMDEAKRLTARFEAYKKADHYC